MSERTFSVGSLEARHFPDHTMELDANGNRQRYELPGKVQIGVQVDGVFVPLAERKAAGLFSDIERAKQAAEADAGSTEV